MAVNAEQIPVLLHAADPISKAGLESALRWHPRIVLVGPGSAETALVAIVAAESLDEAALRVMRCLRAEGCTRQALVVNSLSDSELLAAVEADVCAVVWRSEATPSRLTEIVVRAASGAATLPPDLLARLMQQVSRLQHTVLSPMGLRLGGLSEREADVLRLAADGFDTDEIARKLSYSRRTITNTVHDVIARFHLSNRTHAVAYVIRQGLI